jgi:two-component system sensor histidine kinase KdpD
MERSDTKLRPSPDALLAVAGGGTRGRLKIFLGAAPGVGKTYEMLSAARARRAEGVDVLVGVVETHGRRETEALLQGLEVIPRRSIAYKGRSLEEMDLDAVLARRPALVLVDELAHTNPPESRHPKRYLDVEELLTAGIDVYTTLNVQHIESLNDIVAQITRVRVQETVPDGVVDRADDIELIDLTPSDLIQRLKDGKVYVSDTASRALENYFSPGNLTALRELALRRTAQRVDEQLLTHMQANAIAGPWGAGERILVCVDTTEAGPQLVRYGRRMAERLRAPWTVLHVETPQSLKLTEAERDRLAQTLRGAERLGAETAVLPGRSILDEILAFAVANNVTHIVIAKSRSSFLKHLLSTSLVEALQRRSGEISLHLVAAAPPGRTTAVLIRPELGSLEPTAYALTALIIAAATAVGIGLHQVLDVRNVALVFLVGVLVTAVSFGLWPALFACVLSMLAFNFFFLPPLYTFTIADPESVIALLFFLVVAVIASNLTARVRNQAVVARQRAKTTEDLYQFSKKLAAVGTLDDVLWAAAFQIASMLRVRVVLLLPEATGLQVKAGYPPEDHLQDADVAAARWAFENNRPAGRGSESLPGARRLFLPMRTGRGAVGVVGIDGDRDGPLLSPEGRRLLDALSDQAALAVERVNLVEDVDQARLAAATDRLRTALLTSISHDLRTPLASILGSAGTLRDFSGLLDEPAKHDLLGTIQEEAERLNRFIANLLDMTRLESGAIRPNLALHDLDEMVGSALARARVILGSHRLVLEIEPGLPPVHVDPVLFEQALFNLLDNAAKYASDGTAVTVSGRAEARMVRLAVIDEGPGIPPEDLDRIFDKFHRVEKQDKVRAGTGLGLGISRGFVEAMGGTLEASNRSDRRGAVFTIALPAAEDVGAHGP